MSPDDLGARVAASLEGATVEVSFGQVTVAVSPESWIEAALLVRDEKGIGCGFFDWLSAHDEPDGGVSVVLHVWSVVHRHHLRLQTRPTGTPPRLPSLTRVWAGANWHERETFEMFGVVFDDHPNLVPLLLPEGFEGHPLRKEFVLASRVAKVWPGAKEPGESDRDTDHASPGRRRMLPPGVPDPSEWGPDAAPGDVE